MPSNENFVVVTGSSSGIGRAIALKAASNGASLLIHGCRNRQGADETAALVRSMGRTAEVVMADLSDEAERKNLVQLAFAYAPVHAWVHSAGADVLTGEISQTSFEEKLDLLWQVDVKGTILLARQVANRMLEARHLAVSSQASTDGYDIPSMVFIGWDQATEGMEGDAGQMFGPIKAAVTSYAKNLAQHLAPHVRVNCVAPGWIRTEWGENTNPYWDRRARGSSLMGRWGTPEDVAAAVNFLISPGSNFLTGQILEVNGGWNRRFDRS